MDLVMFVTLLKSGWLRTMAEFTRYLTVKKAANYLGVAPNTIRNWDRDGKITGVGKGDILLLL